jgi:hypothetical protein
MKHVLWIVTFALCASVWANAQTIADIARRERAKRQDPPRPRIATIEITGKPAPVEPPKDSPAAKTQPAPAAAATASPAAPTPPSETQPRQDSRDEKWWRGEFEKARIDVRRGENQVAVAQLELNAANRDFLTRAYDPDGRGPAAIAAATAKLDAAQKHLESARAGLARLEEELRRAGAPAGWAR